MRQFLSPRFWLTLLALGAVVLGLVLTFRGSPPPPGRPAEARGSLATHRVDLIATVSKAVPGAGFAVDKGVSTADVALQLDANRTMVVKAGTPGDITCTQLDQPDSCAVAADLLGDGVVWFSIVPGVPGATLQLPGVISFPEAGWMELANHWLVHRSSTVERSCPIDTSSLTDFVHTFGVHATTTFNLQTQKATKVTCANGGVITTDSLVPPVTGPVVSGPTVTGPVGTDKGTNEGDSVPPKTP